MNPVEIEEAVSSLALEAFDATEFPFQFLRAFGNKETAIQRLRAGNTNQTDVSGAVLQRSHIHIGTCATFVTGWVFSKLWGVPDRTNLTHRVVFFMLSMSIFVFVVVIFGFDDGGSGCLGPARYCS